MSNKYVLLKGLKGVNIPGRSNNLILRKIEAECSLSSRMVSAGNIMNSSGSQAHIQTGTKIFKKNGLFAYFIYSHVYFIYLLIYFCSFEKVDAVPLFLFVFLF